MIKPDKIIRAKRKTMSIKVVSSGEVVVRAPYHYSEKKIIELLNTKEDWVKTHQARLEKNRVKLPKGSLDGYVFPLFGEEWTIKLFDGNKLVENHTEKIVYIPKESMEKGTKRLVKWLKERLKEQLLVFLSIRTQQMGTTYGKLEIGSARTKWGTCSRINDLRFTFRLAFMPPPVIDYLVVHEMAHIFERNHGKKFWAIVEKYRPDYENCLKYLKVHSSLMNLF